MPGPPKSHRGSIGAFLLATALVCLSASAALAIDSPNGDHAGAWPSSWRAYLLSGGSKVSDVIGDVGCGAGYCDVSSGTSGTLNSVYFTSDGVNGFFRIRLAGDPRKASAGGFQSTTYMLQIAVNGVARVAVGLDGKNPQRDFVYVANADGTAHTEVYATPFNNAGGEFSAGARGLPDGSGQYFVDWQVPLARITQRSGGTITGSTPVQLFFGTSQSANLAVLNKDFMIGSSVDFGGGSTVTLVLPKPVAPIAVPPGATPAPGAPAPVPPVTFLPDASVATGAPSVDPGLAALVVVALLALIRPRRRSSA
jgi:MYXO-CTERM domain-containing protein